MYAPYPENMMESIKKVEATRAQRMATEPRRLTAEEKELFAKSAAAVHKTNEALKEVGAL